MKIGLIGAFDRNNYGDVLMPILLKKRIEKDLKDVDFYYYGLVSSNMEYIKGLNTESLLNIYNKSNKYDALIIVGGQVLNSKYTNMYLNLQNNYVYITIFKILYKINPSLSEKICRKKLNGQEINPWIIDKDKVNTKYLIYNTVGGKEEIKSNEIKNIIAKFDYISLREESSYKKMTKINPKSKLYPDSVVLLSEILNDDDFYKNVRKELIESLKKIGNYFVFQSKNSISKKNINEIVSEIEKIYYESNISCVLLPIGYAQGHEDQKVLKKIYNKLKTPSLFSSNNIYETAYIIKNSKMYVGTSLHGAITAISYNVPHIALTNKIQKLNEFLKTWNTTPIIYTDFKNISHSVNKILTNDDAINMLQKARKKMIKESNDNYFNILKILKGDIK